MEYELEVIECEKLLKFYHACSTLLYMRVWSLYRLYFHNGDGRCKADEDEKIDGKCKAEEDEWDWGLFKLK